MRVEVTPDLIVHNARIATCDPEQPQAAAMAIYDGRIAAVGPDSRLRQRLASDTQVLDAGGRRIIPALMDNHTHFLLASLDHPSAGAKVNLAWAQSIEEIVEAIGRRAAVAQPGEWIVTSAMYRGALKEGRFPTRHDLDPVSPDNPVYIFQSGKNIIVNSEALRLAGITEDSDDSTDPEGFIVRDTSGVPTGHLIAGAADMARLQWWAQLGMSPKMWDFLTFPTETAIAGLEAHGQALLACGVTAIRDMGVSPDELDVYLAARAQDRLPLRADLVIGLPARYLSTQEVEGLLQSYFGPKQGLGDDWLSLGGLKVVVQNDGWWALSPDKLRTLLMTANRNGWRLAIHVSSGTAPEATSLVLDILEAAHVERPIDGRRFTYEHGFGLTDHDHIRRVAKLGMIVAASPLLAYYGAARSSLMHTTLNDLRITKSPQPDPQEHATKDWGLAIQDWLAAGITVTAGTDNPAVPYDPEHPFLGIYHLVTGDTLAGPLLADQTVSREQALRMFTINNAHAVDRERTRGSLRPGKVADFAMLSDDLLTCPEDQIPNIKVLTTVMNGKVVFQH